MKNIRTRNENLIYLGIALATGSKACIVMMNKQKCRIFQKEKFLEAFKIARYAEATRVVGNAEKIFEQLLNNKTGVVSVAQSLT